MDPLTPYSQKIDLQTENGRKVYESCTKALPVIFDAVAGKHHVFLTSLNNAVDGCCRREICHIAIGNPPITFDILIQRFKICILISKPFGQVLFQIRSGSTLGFT
jgi:hypothetical protein